ncbi:hypothetical protein [Desulfuromonas sp. AOP6]|uniref:hypothetical protein n=1 Tax=Desulfuromonas sp. AOP6 TaxID=1566351 RepID=UPI00128170A8|nr:hypothetical protein [Desulfuromonas sp. AOP6]BCA79206.1 hypothetical protein AOP6_0993 [Desulfuromonas sp. AOP6]
MGRLAVFIVAVFWCLQVSAVVQAATDDALAQEIRHLADSIRQLEAGLQAQQETLDEQLVLQKLNVAIGYLNFRSRRIEVMERDLQTSRAQKQRMEDVLLQLEQKDELLEAESQTGIDRRVPDIRQSREEIAVQRSMLKQRVERIESEIVEMETRIYALQSQIDSVESFVEKHLKI